MSARRRHDPEHAERASLYALDALPASEADEAAAGIAACAECREEVDALRPVIGSFVSWPTDVLRPPTSLWGRLARRIAAETGEEPAAPAARRAPDAEWEDVIPGVSVKRLAKDEDNERVTMLVRLAPGADYPPHVHGGVEELHLLDGELMIDDRNLHPGDYSRAESGSTDRRVRSETGCTCVLITSSRDVLR